MTNRKLVSIIGDLHLTARPPRSRVDNYLESVFNKLLYVADRSDVVIILGDVIDAKVMSNESIVSYMSQLIGPKMDIRFILGNHDLYSYNVSTYNRSSLAIFEMLGIMKPIWNRTEIEGVLFDVIPFGNKFKEITPTFRKPSVLLGHYYFDYDLEPNQSISNEDVKGCGYDYLFLGHDHEEHENVEVEGTTIIRTGSIARNNAKKFNLKRDKIAYTEMVVGEGEIFSVHKVFFPKNVVKSAREVFDSGVFEKESMEQQIFQSSLEDLINAFSSRMSHEVSIDETLREVGAPEQVISYLRDVHERCNLDF